MNTTPLSDLKKRLSLDTLKLIPLKDDKSKAPTSRGAGYNKPEYVGLSDQEADSHLKGGGCLGLVIPAGWIAVDVDDQETGELVLNAIKKNRLHCHTAQTPRGFHFLFKDTGAVEKQRVKVLTSGGIVVDYRLSGKGYIVIPTMNTAGREWLLNVDTTPPLPSWLEPLRLAKDDEASLIPIRDGRRDDTFFQHSGRLRTILKDESKIQEVLSFMNANFTFPPMGDYDFQKAIRLEGRDTPSGYSHQTTSLDSPHFDTKALDPLQELELAITGDQGNARLLHKLLDGTYKWTDSGGGWFKWTGKKWQLIPETQAGTECQQKLLVEYNRLLTKSVQERDRRELYVKKVREVAKIKNVAQTLTTLKGFEDIAVDYEDFDGDPLLLNCKNGTLNLRTGDLLAHYPETLLTKALAVEYHPEATCPAWDKFLNEIMNGNQGDVDFLRRAVGYSLTGDTGERCFFTLHGSGANGKTTFLETLVTLLGDYADSVDFSTFIDSDGRDSSYKNAVLAKLKGKRLVIAGESKERKTLDSELIKKVSGKDTISARWLYGKPFTYKSQFKIFLATNHRPVIRDKSPAIWDRVKLIPFNVTIPPESRIRNLDTILTTKDELSGILAWAVRGCLEWQRLNGLRESESVRRATSIYQAEMDSVGAFLGENVTLETGSSTPVRELNECYSQWCNENGQREDKPELIQKLRDLGLKQTRTKDGRLWNGLRLKT